MIKEVVKNYSSKDFNLCHIEEFMYFIIQGIRCNIPYISQNNSSNLLDNLQYYL